MFSALLVATGCSEPRRPTFSLATGNPSGIYYPLGGGLASIWSRHLTEVNVKAEVTAASVTNLVQVAKRESELAFTQADALAAALEGTGRFPEPLPLAVLARLYPNLVHLVTVEGSGIRSVEDLRGKRVSVGAPGSGNAVTTWNILAAVGIGEADFDVRQLNYTETTGALRDGMIDAGFISGGIGTAAVVELATSRPIRLVAFSDAEMERIHRRVPAYTPFTVPPGTYRGVDDPVQTPSLWNFLVAHREMDPDLAYRLIETLFAYRKELESISRVARAITPASAAEVGSFPLHPGAARYYGEIVSSGDRRSRRSARSAPPSAARPVLSRARSGVPRSFLLVLEDDRSGAPLASYSLRPGERIIYRYRHSLERQLVEEGLELGTDGVLYVVFSRSPQHGPGHVPRTGRWEISRERPGWQLARGLALPLTPFVSFVSEEEVGASSLLWRGREISLSRRYPNRHVRWRILGR